MRAEAALGSQEGHTGAAGADTPGQTWVRSRACAVRRKQRPGDDACVHGETEGAAGSIWMVRDTSSCLSTAAQSLSSAESRPGFDVWLHH